MTKYFDCQYLCFYKIIQQDTDYTILISDNNDIMGLRTNLFNDLIKKELFITEEQYLNRIVRK